MQAEKSFEQFMSETSSYFEVDETMRQSLKSSFEIVEPCLDVILHSFYEKIQDYPVLKEFIAHKNIDGLKSAQKNHWRSLFLECGTDSYANSARRIGGAHERIGLSPHWYIGGYVDILCALNNVLIDTYIEETHKGWFTKGNLDKEQLKLVLNTVARAVFFDMAIAISVYDQKQTHLESILNKTEFFTNAVIEQIEESVAATEELSASGVEISRDIKTNSDDVANVDAQMHKIQDVVKSFGEMTENISEILGLIHNVSDQINLLSLNAAIESARAGEAGRGFAVVADEVRKLAGETDSSVKDISEKIEEIQKLAHTVVDEVDHIAVSITDVNERSASMRDTVQQQTAATEQISENFHNMREHVNTVGQEILEIVHDKKNIEV